MKTNIARFSAIGIMLPVMMIMLSLNSCDKENDSFRNERAVEGRISFLDIIDAKSLIIAPGSGMLKSGGNIKSAPAGNSLFKITENGFFEEIKYYRVDTIYIETEEGVEMQIDSTELTDVIYPVQVVNATDEYIIATFYEEQEDDQYHPFEYHYLARKSDGAVFSLPGQMPRLINEYNHYHNMFRNEGHASIQTDQDGNIYYIGGWTIYKLDIRDPENLTLEALTAETTSGAGANNFRVTNEGNIAFLSDGVMFRYNTGRLQYPEKPIGPFWKGFDNKLYHEFKPEITFDYPGYPFIERITFENEDASFEEVGMIDHPDAEYSSVVAAHIFKLKNLNKIIIAGLGEDMWQGGMACAEVYNDEMEVKGFSLADLGLTSVNIGMNSDNYYYLAGMAGNQPSLIRVDPSGFPHVATDLIPKGELDIYKMIVSADDVVTFHAQRMSTGNIIIGEISPSGVITELENIGSDVMQLIRVQ